MIMILMFTTIIMSKDHHMDAASLGIVPMSSGRWQTGSPLDIGMDVHWEGLMRNDWRSSSDVDVVALSMG
jgi:hypothetical protein